MRRSLALALILAVLAGCASFKELQPNPPIDPTENGYISVADGDKMFLLLKEEKRFIRFPAPRGDGYYLALKVPRKSLLPTYLTREREYDDVSGPRIPDSEAMNDILSVYPVDNLSPSFLWVVPYTPDDIPLTLTYRYVSRWRYAFEQRRQGFRDSLQLSLADRTHFDAINPAYNLEVLDILAERRALELKHGIAVALQSELNGIRSLFPAVAIAANDTAFREYTDLCRAVDDEVAFQNMYDAVLVAFETERSTRGQPEAFLEAASQLAMFMRQDLSVPKRIKDKARTILQVRLGQASEHFDGVVLAKQDLQPIRDLQPLRDLYHACDIPPDPRLTSLLSYIERFNHEAKALGQFHAAADMVQKAFPSGRGLPEAEELDRLVRNTGDAASLLPEPEARNITRYGSSPSAAMLQAELRSANDRVAAMNELYGGGSSVVSLIGRKEWPSAESRMKELLKSSRIGSRAALSSQRDSLLSDAEKRLFSGVLNEARRRAKAFINGAAGAIAHVPRLYEDSAFVAPYDISFSMAGPDEISRKRSAINRELAEYRDYVFPSTAIKTLYRAFQKNPLEKGVERARAILDHEKKYKGKDGQVLSFAREVDVSRPKTITQARKYRSVFVLPVKRTNGGSYEYGFKIQLRIPTTAEFPVYDLNLKLPEDVASNASTSRWYTSIRLDNKPIRNEGRFRITSPSAESDYVSLISPVEMDKSGRNVLEVRFEYPTERVFQVGAMAQPPIIRKN